MACEIITPERAEEATMMGINISCFIMILVLLESDYTKGDGDVNLKQSVCKGMN